MERKLMTQNDMVAFKDYAVESKGMMFIITKQPDGQIYSLTSFGRTHKTKNYKKIKDLTRPHEMRVAEDEDYRAFEDRLI